MLTFLKSKPLLKELIPNDYVDIHSHLLPGIDDGAQTIEDTFFLIGGLQNIGFQQSITTPHIMKSVWDNTKSGIENKLKTTQESLGKNQIKYPLKAAAEYLLDDNFMKLFHEDVPLLTLKDNYVLVEMSYLNPPIQLYDLIFELQVAGYQPVLAHPERYTFYHHDFDQYNRLKHAGCLFQLNLLSTVGYYGENIIKITDRLLKTGMIDYVGSDVHHQKHLEGFSKKILIKDLAPLKEAIANNQFFRFS